MRFFGILPTALLFTAVLLFNFSSAGLAQTTKSSAVFGTANCSQQFYCPDDSNFSSEVVNSSANICITQFFGYNSPNGFFDDSAGLDSNDCLSSKPNTIPKGMGAQLVPRCCVVKPASGASSCSLHCDIVSQ